jgi:hypothetical protein
MGYGDRRTPANERIDVNGDGELDFVVAVLRSQNDYDLPLLEELLK